MKNRPVPEYLRMIQPWLKLKTLGSQPPTNFKADNWRNGRNLTDQSLDYVLSRHPTSINRVEIATLAQTVYESGYELEQVKRLFWGVMLWGQRDGTGQIRVGWMLSNAAVFGQLTAAFQQIGRSNIGNAYDLLRSKDGPRLKYLDEAFFSKFFYFIGLGCDLQRYPIILDSKVSQSLDALGVGVVTYTKEGYLQYVEMVHNWAEQLQCRADAIEYALFLLPFAFWSE